LKIINLAEENTGEYSTKQRTSPRTELLDQWIKMKLKISVHALPVFYRWLIEVSYKVYSQ
jgi:hypothetical protein